jgi:oligopeptide/dipeptide ABC transporter ATP-binding protein
MTDHTAGEVPLLRVENLTKHFALREGQSLRALDGVSFDLAAGRTVGVVGESGCGKSTLGRAIVGIHKPTSGEIRFRVDGREFEAGSSSADERRLLYRSATMVFQDPASSLNPRKNIRFSVGEPLMLIDKLSGTSLTRRVGELLEAVGLPATYMERFPHAFSGGQRQRVALARALAVGPRLIVADEAVSALDVSVQAQVVNLFLRLQRERGIAFLFISHDLKIVRHVSDSVLVMYLGRVVEQGNPSTVCASPRHPYTEALLSAAPVLAHIERRQRIILKGDPPSPINPPSGCPFRNRCQYAIGRCAEEVPSLRPIAEGQSVACHRAEELSLAGIRTPQREASSFE